MRYTKNTIATGGRAAICLALAGVFALQAVAAGAQDKAEVWVPDEALRVRLELKTGTKPVTAEALATITSLYVMDVGVASLEGMQYCTGLKTANFRDNVVVDLTPLAGLTQLNVLELQGNQITDISPLAGLTALTNLDISNNQISHLGALQAMALLHTFKMENNQVTNLTPLAGAISLERIFADNNQIVNLDALSALPLEGVYLDNNRITDLSALVNNASLEANDRVSINGNPLSAAACSEQAPVLLARKVSLSTGSSCAICRDAEGNHVEAGPGTPVEAGELEAVFRFYLSKPEGPIYDTELATLCDISFSNIEDMSPLAYCVNLRSVDAVYCEGSIEALAAMTGLERFAMTRSNPTSLAPLARMNNLVELDLSYSHLQDEVLGTLPSLPSLRKLDLYYTFVKDSAPLAGVPNLEWLDISHNYQLSTIEPVAAMAHLKHLNLSRCPVSDIGPLASLTQLEALDLLNCRVTDLAPLAGLTNLTFLELSNSFDWDDDGNGIRDLSPLAALTQLRYLGLFNYDYREYSTPKDQAATRPKGGPLVRNRVTDIGVVSNMPHLETLLLHNRSESLYVPSKSNFGGNNVNDLSPLASALEMQRLTLDDNHVCDLAALVANSGIGEGDEISIVSNPLTIEACSVQVPQLQARGLDLSCTSALESCPVIEGEPPSEGAEEGEGEEITPIAVQVPDAALAAQLRAALEKPEGPLLDYELAGIDGLNLDASNIYSLTGLGYCTSLRHLLLNNARLLLDFEPIGQLGELTRLKVSGSTRFNDLSLLQDLTQLEDLEIVGSSVGDLAPLGDLPLRRLHLENCGISDISPLANLFYLVELSLPMNEISDLSPLSDVISLLYVNLDANAITDIAPLANFSLLADLNLASNRIENISPLSGLQYLMTLNLHDNQIAEVSPIAGLKLLYNVDLSKNLICDVSALAANPQFARRAFCLSGVPSEICPPEIDLTGNRLAGLACEAVALLADGRTVVADCDSWAFDCNGNTMTGAVPLPNVLLAGFQLFDADHDGSLTASEANVSGAQPAEISALDMNMDGALSVAELRQATQFAGTAVHAADTDGNGVLSLNEVLRGIQLYNAGYYHCAPNAEGEDGYVTGAAGGQTCTPHSLDYREPKWEITLSELLRLLQFFNTGGYRQCASTAEDGYCVEEK